MADTPKAFWIFCAMSFAESSFFPLPPDLLMIPMVLANRSLAWRLAIWGTITSVLGGFLGYAIGYYLYASLGSWIIDTYNMSAGFEKFHQEFAKWGFWIIALKGLTPVPFKLVTIASGVAHYDLVYFTAASVIARGIRFFYVAAFLWWCGPKAKYYIEKYLSWFFYALIGALVGGFFILNFIG